MGQWRNNSESVASFRLFGRRHDVAPQETVWIPNGFDDVMANFATQGLPFIPVIPWPTNIALTSYTNTSEKGVYLQLDGHAIRVASGSQINLPSEYRAIIANTAPQLTETTS